MLYQRFCCCYCLSVKIEPKNLLLSYAKFLPCAICGHHPLDAHLLWSNDSRNSLHFVGIFHQRAWLLLLFIHHLLVHTVHKWAWDQVPRVRLGHSLLRTGHWTLCTEKNTVASSPGKIAKSPARPMDPWYLPLKPFQKLWVRFSSSPRLTLALFGIVGLSPEANVPCGMFKRQNA